MLEVLPPLLMGKGMVLTFLRRFDKNKKIVDEINKGKFTDLFMQGEGWDKHDIYGVTKDKKYYILGKTKKVYNTEDFRYPDTGNYIPEKVHESMKKGKKWLPAQAIYVIFLPEKNGHL